MKNNFIPILGAGLISYSIALALVENTSFNVAIFSTSPIPIVSSIVYQNSGEKYSKKAITPKKNEETIDELEARMHHYSSRILYISSSDSSFSDIIKAAPFIISACRSGLPDHYVNIFNKIAFSSKKSVISLDNDTSIYKIAISKNTNDAITYCHGIIHAVVNSKKIEQRTIICDTNGYSLLFLPYSNVSSSLDSFHRSFPIIKSCSSIRLCTENELYYINLLKRLEINAPHSILCAYALKNMISTTHSISDILHMKINETLNANDPNLDFITNTIPAACIRYYLPELPATKISNINLNTPEFINYLFRSNQEELIRGMPLTSPEKSKKHIEDLEFCYLALNSFPETSSLARDLEHLILFIKDLAKDYS